MRKTATKVGLLCLILISGCTSSTTKMAIAEYHSNQSHQQVAFDNSCRVANEQMYLNLTQFVKANPDKAIEAIKVTWKARNTLETIRNQYLLARFRGDMTYGMYLWDQRGWLEVIFEDKAKGLKSTIDAAVAADQAAGVSNVTDLIPVLPTAPTTQPASTPGFMDILKQYQNK